MGNDKNGSCSNIEQLGDYRIIKLLKTGGMGEIYLAEQMSMRRIVALKVLQPALAKNELHLERFFREVKNLAKLSHPAIIQAIEAGVESGICYFSMSYVNGTDLKRMIMHHPMTEEQVLKVARATADALRKVWNRHGMIHRDIKPSNLMLTNENELKILDFGISKQAVPDDDEKELTRAGALIGSPYYMSPEQARGSKLDLRADIYSLGATMYHLLTRNVPYEGESSIEVVSLHMSAPEPDVRKLRPDVSEQTAYLIMKMMAKNPDKRYLSWDRVIEAIDKVVEGEEEVELPEDRLKKVRRMILIGSLLLLIVLAASLLPRIFRGGRKKAPATVSTETKVVTAVKETGGSGPKTEKYDPNEDIQRAKRLIQLIQDRAYAYEQKKEYANAMAVWQDYEKNGPLRDNPLFKKEARRAMEYYREKIKLKEKGIINE